MASFHTDFDVSPTFNSSFGNFVYGAPGKDGAPGADGTTFTPAVSDAGVLSWSNDGGKQNPPDFDLAEAAEEAAGVALSGKLDKSGGTMTGALVAQSNQNYSARQVRNILILDAPPTSDVGQDGDVCIVIGGDG